MDGKERHVPVVRRMRSRLSWSAGRCVTLFRRLTDRLRRGPGEHGNERNDDDAAVVDVVQLNDTVETVPRRTTGAADVRSVLWP